MTLLVLAFEAALYPTLLAAVVILLTLERPARLIGAYLAGGMTISVGLGIAIVQLLGQTDLVTSDQSLLSWTADLAIGGLAILAAVALARRWDERMRERRRRRSHATPETARMYGGEIAAEPAEPAEPWTQRILTRGSVPVVFVAALFVNVPGAAYLVALKDIAAGDHALGTEIALILLFNVIMFLLAEIPLAGLLIAPDRTGAFVDRMNVWLREHSRQLAIFVCGSLGFFLVLRGLLNA